MRRVADAAEAGAAATIPLVARKGRASYLGERSAGHLDPGAASSAILVRCLADAVSIAAGRARRRDPPAPVRPARGLDALRAGCGPGSGKDAGRIHFVLRFRVRARP